MKKSLLSSIIILLALSVGATMVQAADTDMSTSNTGDISIKDGYGTDTNTLDLNNGNYGVTVTASSAQLYDINGNKISASLNEGTSWKTDNERYIGNEVYYRVSSNAYVDSSDVYFYQPTDQVVYVNGSKPVSLYDNSGQLIKNSSRALAPGSYWRTDRMITVDHITYFRVSTNEFVSFGDVQQAK